MIVMTTPIKAARMIPEATAGPALNEESENPLLMSPVEGASADCSTARLVTAASVMLPEIDQAPTSKTVSALANITVYSVSGGLFDVELVTNPSASGIARTGNEVAPEVSAPFSDAVRISAADNLEVSSDSARIMAPSPLGGSDAHIRTYPDMYPPLISLATDDDCDGSSLNILTFEDVSGPLPAPEGKATKPGSVFAKTMLDRLAGAAIAAIGKIKAMAMPLTAPAMKPADSGRFPIGVSSTPQRDH
jgi:hypothetical protein